MCSTVKVLTSSYTADTAYVGVVFDTGATLACSVREPTLRDDVPAWCRWLVVYNWSSADKKQRWSGIGYHTDRELAAWAATCVVLRFLPAGEYPSEWGAVLVGGVS